MLANLLHKSENLYYMLYNSDSLFVIYLPVVLLLFCMWYESHATANNSKNSVVDFEDGLFEGDLKIPVEMIMAHYNLSSFPEGIEILGNDSVNASEATINQIRRKRAAGSSINLWPNRIVRYRISSRISSSVARNISTAIARYRSSTCLRFIRTSGTGDYIDFVSTSSGCFSNSIGRKGGRQVINLQNPGCTSVGIIIHEIGHAIGFWHEQSRPDRDQYVDIHRNNIRIGRSSQFMKRSYSEVDYQGSGYDYGSIMHYRRTAFNKPGCRGSTCYTISVNNATEYRRQGSPTLGNRVALSTQDIFQVKRLYSCPGGGVRGILTVNVRRGNSLRYTDGSDIPDPYVVVTAVDSSGSNVRRLTSRQQNRRHPVWNQRLSFGNRNWQFFRISAWDADSGSDDQVTMSKTVSVSRGNHYSLKTCENSACSSYILYDYYLNTATTTTITTTPTPTMVQNTQLRVYVRYARNLRDTDPIFNLPDPYVRIRAVRSGSSTVTRTTRSISGTTRPTWNQWIDFGCQRWNSMLLQIWDRDTNRDDAMSNVERKLLATGSHSYIRHAAHGSGYMYYDYRLTVDRNNCSPNPCLNGGTCRDGCLSYTCTCRTGYSGTRCERTTRSLRVYARYARNLRDRDGWLNKSDPYMEVIAVDVNGNSLRRTTRHVQGNHNPNWNTSLYFGRRAWRYFRVRVYDADPGSDDALSSQQTFYLSGSVTRTGVTHRCYSGYAVFNYYYN